MCPVRSVTHVPGCTVVLAGGRGILTAGHALAELDGDATIHVIPVGGAGFQARVASVAYERFKRDAVDLGRLVVEGVDMAGVRVVAPAVGELVIGLGFPEGFGLSDGDVLMHGGPDDRPLEPIPVLARVESERPLSLSLVAGAMPLEGMSGSPFFDLDGDCVGILSSVEAAERTSSASQWRILASRIDEGWAHAEHEAVEDPCRGQTEHPAEDVLGALWIGEVGKAVVGTGVARARAIELTAEPFTAIDVDLERVGHPDLDADVHDAEVAIDEVGGEVQVLGRPTAALLGGACALGIARHARCCTVPARRQPEDGAGRPRRDSPAHAAGHGAGGDAAPRVQEVRRDPGPADGGTRRVIRSKDVPLPFLAVLEAARIPHVLDGAPSTDGCSSPKLRWGRCKVTGRR